MRGLVLVCALAGAAIAQPGQIAIGNAASFSQSGAAPGSLIEIGVLALFESPGFYYTIDPSTVKVSLQLIGSSGAVNLAVVSVGQPTGPVIALLPANTALGAASVTVSIAGKSYPPGVVYVVPSSFGLFTNGQNGTGPALAMNVANNGVALSNQLTHPARTHQYVTLWGTGLGNAAKDQVRVLLGGKPQIVLYAGPAPGEPGVDQINFFVSADPTVPNGCYVAVQVEAAGTLSNEASISKAPANTAGACENPLGLTASQMATLDAGGSLDFSALNVSASIMPPQPASAAGGFVRSENGNLDAFTMQHAADIARYTEPLVSDDVLFTCSFESSPAEGTAGGVFAVLVAPTGLGWGHQVTLSGGGQSLDLVSGSAPVPFYTGGNVSAAVADPGQFPAPLFTAGLWMFSSAGPPAFQLPLTFSPEIEATNFGALQTIGRSQDVTVTWNPAGFGQNDAVTATLQDTLNSPFYFGGGAIVCRVPALNGQVTFPANLLNRLPASSGVRGLAPTLSLAVGAKPGTAPVFSLPLTDGTQLPAVFRQSSVELWPIMVQ